jgi:hypothetical protein
MIFTIYEFIVFHISYLCIIFIWLVVKYECFFIRFRILLKRVILGCWLLMIIGDALRFYDGLLIIE